MLRCPGGDVDSPIDWYYKTQSRRRSRARWRAAPTRAAPTSSGRKYDELMLADVQSANLDVAARLVVELQLMGSPESIKTSVGNHCPEHSDLFA